jgi:putative transposase
MLGDERILGDSDFVERVLKESGEWEEERSRKRRSLGVGQVIARAAKHAGIDAGIVKGAGKVPAQCRARALACYWLVESLGMPEVAVARHLQITQPAVSRNVMRGKEIAARERIKLEAR